MKVEVFVKVRVEQEAWASEFGVENTPEAVKADVKQYIKILVTENPVILGLAEGTPVGGVAQGA